MLLCSFKFPIHEVISCILDEVIKDENTKIINALFIIVNGPLYITSSIIDSGKANNGLKKDLRT